MSDDAYIEEEVLDEVIAYTKRNYCSTEHKAACVAFATLSRSGHADFILLGNDAIRAWWQDQLTTARKRIQARKLKQRKDAALASALAKLTDAERLALGLRKPTKRASTQI